MSRGLERNPVSRGAFRTPLHFPSAHPPPPPPVPPPGTNLTSTSVCLSGHFSFCVFQKRGGRNRCPIMETRRWLGHCFSLFSSSSSTWFFSSLGSVGSLVSSYHRVSILVLLPPSFLLLPSSFYHSPTNYVRTTHRDSYGKIMLRLYGEPGTGNWNSNRAYWNWNQRWQGNG